MSSLISVFTNPQDAHFWIFIALLVLIAILWRAKIPGMAVKALDEIGANVQAQLDEAHRLRQEAEARLAQIKSRRAETEHAAEEMLKAAEEDAKRLRIEAAQLLEEDIRRREALAERKIALAESQAAMDVRAAAVELAAEASEAVLSARIISAKSDPLIEAGLNDLAGRFRSTAS